MEGVGRWLAGLGFKVRGSRVKGVVHVGLKAASLIRMLVAAAYVGCFGGG